MFVFSVTALDRLIESDRRSSSSSASLVAPLGSTAMDTDREKNVVKEKRPLYVSYPYSSRESASPPPRGRTPSPSGFSPSPYVVNHKRRVPGVVATRNTSQQNGFHVSEKSPATSSSDSQELVLRPGEERKIEERRVAGDAVSRHGSPRSSLSQQVQSSRSIERDMELSRKRFSNEHIPIGRGIPADEKTKGKQIAGESWIDLRQRNEDVRGKKKIEDKAEERITPDWRARPDWGLGSTSENFRIPPSNQRSASQSLTGEEFFDAPDIPLEDYSSDDETTRFGRSSLGAADSSGNSDIAAQLQVEKLRRIKVEEALAALEQQRNEMVQMLYSAGIAVSESGFGDDQFGKYPGQDCNHESEALVARVVAGAIARGAVRAEAEAELETVVVEKNRDIARLRDKLQYYELVNREMSQRNQEAMETARRRRRRRQRRQFVMFSCLGGAVLLGVSAVLAYHYMPWEHMTAFRQQLSTTGEQLITDSLDDDVCEPAPEQTL